MKRSSPLFYFLLLLTCFSSTLRIDAAPIGQTHTFFIEPANADTAQVRICLTMIVKNESKIIERCLNSVKGVVDCISICDTGSTDETVAIIENFMKKNGIPGKVHRAEWKNFGHNRTLSAKLAQKTIQELNYPLSKTYLLLIDADMMLEVSPEFNKQALDLDAYSLIQKSTEISYDNTRLVRAIYPWRSVGVTHEYWSCDVSIQQKRLDSLVVDDREDGGSKSDKFERDAKLLIKGLEEEPNNERYMFYLAQTYHCLSDHDKAIEWYKKRIERGGWYEEKYYSMFTIGESYKAKGDWPQALKWYLEAYQNNPARAESLYAIATYYRQAGENELCCLFAEQGAKIPFPKDQSLFISYPIYDYKFDEELSIAAYYTKDKKRGEDAINRLIVSAKVPGYSKDLAYRNLVFYVEPLQDKRFIPIKINLPYVREDLGLKYNPMNPSIIKTREGYTVICRTVNYEQKGAATFTAKDPDDSTIRTRNFLVKYDKKFNLLSQDEIVEDLKRERHPWRIVEGLEDARLFSYRGDLWFTATTFDTQPNAIELSLSRLVRQPKNGKIEVDKLVPLRTEGMTNCEKNWLPFVKEGDLLVAYCYNPLTFLKVNVQTGECLPYLTYKTKMDLSRFRGSAAPIPFDGGYLMLVHEVAVTDERFYLHRLLFLDKNLKPVKMSKPFVFQHKGVEYCLAMTTDHDDKNLVFTIGLEDREASFCLLPLDKVRELLVLEVN